MKQPFKIKQVRPNIFQFIFEHQYDLCMHFLRYQEYYESPNPKFRNKSFTIFDFMEWYAKTYGDGAFTYPRDWSGFNIPSYIIKKIFDRLCADNFSHRIIDFNDYDQNMFNAYDDIQTATLKDRKAKFYIIGTTKDNAALDHELSHAYFYLNPEYKKKMVALVKSLPDNTKIHINAWLKDIGYTKQVFVDETQAYFATGFPKSFKTKPTIFSAQKSFQKIFNEYNGK